MNSTIPVVIPAYEPDGRLILLLRELQDIFPQPVILVDDGSGPAYNAVFQEAAKMLGKGGVLLTHTQNRGKGRALKTAFTYALNHYPDAPGVVTADSDGQHTAFCIRKTGLALKEHPQNLILGVRTFDGEDVPWKSRFGNKLTSSVLRYVSGIRTSDTQTGLRGIPASFMRKLISVKGDRFEFEMRMLLESSPRYPICEVPIQTIYDSKDHHQTHFAPVRDSIRIYRILGWKFIKYILSSLSSSLLDLTLFSLFCALPWLDPDSEAGTAFIATILARTLSSFFNYMVNFRLVFQSRQSSLRAGEKYFLLAVLQMTASAVLVSGTVRVLPAMPAVAVKACVDTMLFFLSYTVQRKFIFT